MHSGEHNTLARHAINVAQGQNDPNLLIACKRKLLKPKRAARWLAGLANAAHGRQGVLLMGIQHRSVVGIKEPPRSSWLAEVNSWWPGVRPELSWELVTVGDADVLAVMPEPVDDLVAAYRRSEVVVPWVEDGGLGRAPMVDDSTTATTSAPISALSAQDCWIERSSTRASGVDVDVYRGVVELSIGSTPGIMADESCSATLLLLQDHAPVELDIQLHPAPGPVGIERRASGIVVHGDFGVHMYLAGALLHQGVRSSNHSARLVISVLLPGRSVPELRSFPLVADAERPNRWRYRTESGGAAR